MNEQEGALNTDPEEDTEASPAEEQDSGEQGAEGTPETDDFEALAQNQETLPYQRWHPVLTERNQLRAEREALAAKAQRAEEYADILDALEANGGKAGLQRYHEDQQRAANERAQQERQQSLTKTAKEQVAQMVQDGEIDPSQAAKWESYLTDALAHKSDQEQRQQQTVAQRQQAEQQAAIQKFESELAKAMPGLQQRYKALLPEEIDLAFRAGGDAWKTLDALNTKRLDRERNGQVDLTVQQNATRPKVPVGGRVGGGPRGPAETPKPGTQAFDDWYKQLKQEAGDRQGLRG